jgi:hypothetical protein
MPPADGVIEPSACFVHRGGVPRSDADDTARAQHIERVLEALG